VPILRGQYWEDFGGVSVGRMEEELANGTGGKLEVGLKCRTKYVFNWLIYYYKLFIYSSINNVKDIFYLRVQYKFT